jgi:hypothetical protein
MAPLSILALATWLPESRPQNSLLGQAVPLVYGHLYAPAGATSRPPTVARGATSSPCAPYDAPAADAKFNVAQMASAAAERLLSGQTELQARVQAVLHTQCTLNQQILASSCLRICHEHLPATPAAQGIGQLGTAGLPTVLQLAAVQLEQLGPHALVCASASDKWMAPFFRRVPGVVTYADAAGACLVGSGDEPAVAVVHDIRTSVRPFDGDLWTAPADALREHLVAHAASVIDAVRDRGGPPPALVGDGYDHAFLQQLAGRTGLALLDEPEAASELHCASAAPLFAIARAVAAAVQRQQVLDVIVWTVSMAGFAGAVRIRCRPDSHCKGGTWQTASIRAMSAPQPAREST